jgi:hypothetical protein
MGIVPGGVDADGFLMDRCGSFESAAAAGPLGTESFPARKRREARVAGQTKTENRKQKTENRKPRTVNP